jgi:hypothetical protein
MLLAQDETDLLLFPPLRACWTRRGEPAQVVLSGRNARRVIFGTLNLTTGHRLLLPRRYQKGVDFQEFLRFIYEHYCGWPVALLLDEDTSHTAGLSEKLARILKIHVIWLPKRSPHLNPMDHLWRDAKAVVCANRQYESIDDEVERFMNYIYQLSPHEALTKAGVLSEHFWLRHAMSKYFW